MTVTIDPDRREPGSEEPAQTELSMALAARVVLATPVLAAGVVHLVMVPGHAQASTLDAVGFAVVGWTQLLLAGALLVRPSRAVLATVVVVNTVVLAVWAWSRTVGLPVGGHAGEAQPVQLVDGMTAAFQAAAVLGAVLLLARPALAEKVSEPVMVLGSIVPVAVLVATSVALADPNVASHGHGPAGHGAAHAHGGADHDAEMAAIASRRCDLDINPAAYWNETAIAGIDTVMGGSHPEGGHGAGHGAGHGHASPAIAQIQGSPELDRLIALTSEEGGETKDARVIVELSETDDATYEQWLRWLPTYTAMAHARAGTTAGAPDDKGGHGGHLGPQPWIAMTDPAECDRLRAELAEAREVALRYPTAADAMAAGWVQVTPYVPGIAAHYMRFGYVDDEFVISEPEMLLYDGEGPQARVVGLSYYLIHDSAMQPTQGFTGPNDHFHRHVGLCIGPTGVIGDSAMTAEECAAIGGRKADGSGGWMNHAWVVPGCESPWGMFSGASPLLDPELARRAGTNAGGCAGSGVRDRYDLSPGSPANTPTTVRGEQAATGVDQP